MTGMTGMTGMTHVIRRRLGVDDTRTPSARAPRPCFAPRTKLPPSLRSAPLCREPLAPRRSTRALPLAPLASAERTRSGRRPRA
eukprot:10433850-Alexandrium_andersonii.AAC.1